MILPDLLLLRSNKPGGCRPVAIQPNQSNPQFVTPAAASTFYRSGR